MGQAKSIPEQLGEEFADIRLCKFRNLKNTCFCNSILQSLLNSTHVSCYLNSIKEIISTNGLPECFDSSPLMHFYVFYSILQNSEEREILINPQDFMESLYKNVEIFEKGVQHDAHEFFLYLISSFDSTINDLNRVYGKSVLPPFSQLFQGVHVSSFTCSLCNHCKETRETFTFLSIAITGNADLQQLIDDALAPEDVIGSNGVMCPKCDAIRDSCRMSYFAQAPPVLVIQLQRFHFDPETSKMNRIGKNVKIPDEITLNSATGSQIYHLKSIIMHSTMWILGGHYVSIMKFSNNWVMADDKSLSIVPEVQMTKFLGIDCNHDEAVPYVLFYE